MNKMQIAHEYALKQMESLSENSTMQRLVSVAWQYADAMQAEAEKREDKERPGVLDGWKKGKPPVRPFFKPDDKEEWQPDWSQAPAWANWWAIDLDGNQAHWYEVEPAIDAITWRRRTRTCKQAPSFNYQGNWQDSLRKRPQ